MTPTPPRKGFFVGTPWKHPHPSGHEADPAKTQLACSKRSQLNSPRPKPNSCESWAEASTQGCGSSLNGPWPSPKNNRADPVCCCSQRGRPRAKTSGVKRVPVTGHRRDQDFAAVTRRIVLLLARLGTASIGSDHRRMARHLLAPT